MTREEKLAMRQREHRQLSLERKAIVTEYNRAHKKLNRINEQIKSVGHAIYDLKNEGDTPEVTDHAIVRYLERVEKMDIRELKLKVANDKNAHREGNVIVTVNQFEEIAP